MERDEDTAADPRLAGLLDWVAARGYALTDWAVASADASFRRYFRVWSGGRSLIAMDAPPEREDSRPFVRVAGLLAGAGVNAPRVLAADLEQGYLLLDDLGERTYLEGLVEDEEHELFPPAIDALVRWQAASRPGVLPPYDEALLRRELRLFPDWYLMAHLGWSADDAHSPAWRALEEALVERALSQARVFVHRDFMPRNLMRSTPLPGVIDFQDAVEGPVTYDIASLLRDAFVDWAPAFEERCFEGYWRAARAAGVPVPGDYDAFRADLDWMAAQRHLKVLGIFARLHYRDGKPHYLTEAPRFLRYLHREAAAHDGMAGLDHLLAAVVARA